MKSARKEIAREMETELAKLQLKVQSLGRKHCAAESREKYLQQQITDMRANHDLEVRRRQAAEKAREMAEHKYLTMVEKRVENHMAKEKTIPKTLTKTKNRKKQKKCRVCKR